MIRFTMFLVVILLPLSVRAGAPSTRPSLQRVTVQGDRFVLSPSDIPFVAWGHNHGCSYVPGLRLNDPDAWPRIQRDLADMKRMGSTVVRVHLEVGDVMSAPDKPNDAFLSHLPRLLSLAEQEGIYLDVTGLACFRPASVPPWYNAMDEEQRWAVQCRFWEAVAKACKGSNAVFCYDLMNEPLSPGDKREPGKYQTGALLGGYDFFQWISLDPAGRTRGQIAVQWIRRLTAAIRKHDKDHPITVGIPWASSMPHISGFEPAEIAPEVDFLSIHIYPETGKPDDSLALFKTFDIGKPVVVEETFNLFCDVPTLEQFILKTKATSDGYLGHYDLPLAELDRLRAANTITPAQEVFRQWLLLFARLTPEVLTPATRPAAAR